MKKIISWPLLRHLLTLRNDTHIFVVCGPSGAGKQGTFELIRREFGGKLGSSISATTRDRRPGEEDAKNYYFLSHETFMDIVAKNGFIEYADVHQNGKYYGTLKSEVTPVFDEGKSLLLEINLLRGLDILRQNPDAAISSRVVEIFIAPPSMQELANRIQNRHPMGKEEMAERFVTAHDEIKLGQSCRHIVVNDKWQTTMTHIRDIMDFYLYPAEEKIEEVWRATVIAHRQALAEQHLEGFDWSYSL